MSNLDDLTFAQNSDPRCPVVLILDCSSSMMEQRQGEDAVPMNALDSGLDVLISELHKDPLAKRRVELSFVTFGSFVNPATEFSTVDDIVLPALSPMGTTAMGDAVIEALRALEERKATYKQNGISYYRPWIMLITDGLPTDSIELASQKIREAEEKKKLSFFAVGIEGADMQALEKLSVRQPLKLSGMKFDELFVWLSASQASVSASQPGDAVGLPSPAGWAEV